MMGGKVKQVEYKLAFIRRANPKEPAELVLSHGGTGSEQVIILRPSQLDGIIRDAVAARFINAC